MLARVEGQAVEIARAAGDRALAWFRQGITLEFKGQQADDPVTAADRELETFLRDELRRRFPEHGILGEEGTEDIAADAEYVWALDPLDGTANFASGLPLWGVSMGLLRHGVPVLGCVWVPVGPTLTPGVYHARQGGGAWFDTTRLQAAAGADERGRVLALPGRYSRLFTFQRPPAGERRSGVDPRSLGSIVAEMTYVAAGVLRAAVFVQPKVWDVAAGVVIVQESGGRALTWRERRWTTDVRFEALPPRKGAGAPSLRHWSLPIVVGTPSTVDRLAERLIWQPRLPMPLRRVLGLRTA